MTKELFWSAIAKFALGFLLVGLLIFVPAGTLEYRQGWLFMGILFVPMFLAGIVLMVKNPQLLPDWVSNGAAVVFLTAYLMYGEVLRENAYLSRTVEVQAGQKVIDTGLYGIVRHPMYSATILLFLAMPLVLGSILSFGVFLLYPILISFRIRGEEALLEEELPGYAEYKQKVEYRLIPFVW